MISEVDRWLAAELFRIYVLSQEQIADCLNAQLEAQKEGKALPLEEVVLRRGYITRNMLTEVLETIPPEVVALEAAQLAKRAAAAPPVAAEPAKPTLIDSTTAGPQIINEFQLDAILYDLPPVTTYSAASIAAEEQTLVRILNPAAAKEHPQTLEDFRREGALQDAFSHPNLLKGITHGDAKGFPFQVTEHVDGAPLSRLLEFNPIFDLTRQIRVALQVGCALAYLHEKGLAHTNLHPDHIHLFNDGRVKVAGLQHAMVFDPAKAEDSPAKGSTRLNARQAACAEFRTYGLLLYHLATSDGSVWKTGKMGRMVPYVLEGLREAHAQHQNAPFVYRSMIGRLVSDDPLRYFPHLAPLMKRLQFVHKPPVLLVDEAFSFLEKLEPKGRLRREIEALFPNFFEVEEDPEPAAEEAKEPAKPLAKRPLSLRTRDALRRKPRPIRGRVEPEEPVEAEEAPTEEPAQDPEEREQVAGAETSVEEGEPAPPSDPKRTDRHGAVPLETLPADEMSDEDLLPEEEKKEPEKPARKMVPRRLNRLKGRRKFRR